MPVEQGAGIGGAGGGGTGGTNVAGGPRQRDAFDAWGRLMRTFAVVLPRRGDALRANAARVRGSTGAAWRPRRGGR